MVNGGAHSLVNAIQRKIPCRHVWIFPSIRASLTDDSLLGNSCVSEGDRGMIIKRLRRSRKIE